MSLRKVASIGIFMASAPCFAQLPDKPTGEVAISIVDISYTREPTDILNTFARFRVSPEGQAITKAVAEYYGVPPQVVDWSTENVWQKHTGHNDAGNEHKGNLTSPQGYEICDARRLREISITGNSSFSWSVSRSDRAHGVGWYADVPQAGLFEGREWVDTVIQVTFVRNDVWGKYATKCVPSGYTMPGEYIMEDCHHGHENCTAEPRPR